MSRRGRTTVGFSFLTFTFVVVAAIGPAVAFEESAEINRSLRGRDYAKAVSLIDAALAANPKDAEREFLMFRKGLALQYAGKPAEAIAAFEAQVEAFPAGPWANKARMHVADVHVSLKQFDAAEKIYARRVAELVSDERKSEIARVYLDFAEDYFQPKDPLVQPNYERARTFYDKALELEPAGSLREIVLYRRALCNQKLGQNAPAAEQYEAYLLEFDPNYRETKKLRSGERPLPEKAIEGGAYWIEARLGLGECRLLCSDWQESRRVLQDLVTSLEKSETDAALEKSKAGARTEAWIKAMALVARTYRIPTPPDVPNLNSGVDVLDRLIDKHPASREAVQAAFDIGSAFRHVHWSDAAIEAFRALIDRKRIRPEGEETVKLAETLSQSALFQVGELLLSQKKYADAIGTWNQYVAKYPNGPHWSGAQQAIIDAEYAIGADAQSEERFDDARQAWTKFLEKYPLDSRATGILFAFGEMAYQEQVKHVKAGDQPDWNAAIAAWRRLVEKSPGSEDAGRAQFRIGQTLEEKVRDLDAAIEAYQKLNWSNMQALAQERLAEMRSVRLEVATERVFRTNEAAKVRVNVRNIDKLTVKLYRIDMEDYYRKSRSIGGVERLDLLLIDPDKTFDVEVKEFARYKPITQEIEIASEGARVWAVYVSNEKSTGEEKIPGANSAQLARLQATTLVIASDIDILMKSSRGQVLVYAQDMVKMSPASGVQVLVADQSSVFLEGATGEDGFFVSTDKKIQDAAGLSVFANRSGSIAGTALSLGGISFAKGLAPRGYIHTDRPAYRPGDSVNIRGILREVANGAYALPSQPTDKRLRWKLDVIDAKGRTLHSDEISLTEFGTFSALFQVSEDAPVGNYKIIARRVDGPSFEGTFGVETYQLAKASLSLDFTNRVVMRGDRVSGHIVAKYHYGEAVAGKDVEYELHYPNGDVERRSGKTDDAGKIAVEFETSMLPEEGVVQIVARQAELNIGVVDAVYVATRDFTAGLSTVRPLYLSEEPVEARVETRDLKGEPVSREMTVTAFLRTYEKNTWAETKVESAVVTTKAKDGVGRVTMKLTKGGTYVLRAEGKDSHDQKVTAEAVVQVSDDEDATRLRLFSEKENYKVGDSIALDVHSRIDITLPSSPSPLSGSRLGRPQSPFKGEGATGSASPTGARDFIAVLMCEGEGVFQYRTVSVKPGHNEIALPVGHEHFPNFRLSAAVMTGGRLHQASRDFTVERELTIVVKPRVATARPREELAVDLFVTDQQGKPVQGEIGVAMIDAALLAQYPDTTPKIVPFFQAGARRSAESRTETSCVFRYAPATTAMVTEVMEFEQVVDLLSRGSTVAGVTWQGFDGSVDLWSLNRANNNVPKQFGSQYGQPAPAPPEAQLGEAVQSLGYIGAFEDEMDPTDAVAFDEEEEAGRRLTRVYNVQDLMISVPKFRGRQIQLRAQMEEGRKGGLGGGRFIQAGDAVGQGNQGGLFAGGDDAERSVYYSYVAGSALLGDIPGLEVLFNESRGREVFKQQFQSRLFESCQSWYKSGTLDNRKIDKNMADAVRAAPARSYYPEVAYWNPHVVTDAEGKATVTIVLPDTSTTWKIVARGATKETIVGDGSAEVLCKNDFLVEWITPQTLIEGDQFTPRGQVHCLAPFAGTIKVRYEAKRANGEPVASGEKTIEAKASGVFDVDFDAVAVPACEKLSLTLTAEASASSNSGSASSPSPQPFGLPPRAPSAFKGEGAKAAASPTTEPRVPSPKPQALSDSLTVSIPVESWGLRIESHVAGVAKDNDFVEIELPAPGRGEEYHDLKLVVAVGSSMQRWLIEEALETGGRWAYIDDSLKSWRVLPPRTHADTSAVLLGALYAGDYLASNAAAQDLRQSDDRALLEERVAGLVGQLLAAQNDDGGWPWCGKGGESDPWTSASVAWSLGKAKYNGHRLAADGLAKLKAYLQKTFADAPVHQTELKAVVLHGLAWIDEIDFGHANRLYRNRDDLTTSGLAHLALTFAKLDRKSLAAELLEQIAGKSKQIPRGASTLCEVSCHGNSAWMRSELEVTALALLAQLQVDARSGRVPQMVAYLAGTARADGWRPHKAKGPVIAALSTYYATGEKERANYQMTITVNGTPAGLVKSDRAESLVLHLGAGELKDGVQRVDFGFSGRGECAYAVTLSGFKSRYPTPREARNDIVEVNERHVQPPQLEYKGRQVSRGFSVAARYDSFTNQASAVPVGTVVSVSTSFWRRDVHRIEAPDRDYFVVKETIPAGFRLLTETLSGQQLSHDYADNVLTLYYGSREHLGGITYQMVAATPGVYRLPPTVIRSLYRPDVFHLNAEGKTLAVLPRGEKSPDDYRMTPDELYTLGRFHFDDGDFVGATKFLRELLKSDWILNDEPYRESVRMLLTCALKSGDNEAIVNYFEILKEKYADLVIPFAEIIRVAQAYAATGQAERACVVYRATADSSFTRETAVGGVLQQEGRFLDGHDFLVRLWRDYPDTPEVESVYFATTQVLYSKAEEASKIAPRRTADGEKRPVTRAGIMAETIRMLELFVTLYPQSPTADEASYSLVNAYLDLDDFDTVVARTEELIALFPKSKWVDRFRYMQALGQFHLGRFDQALALALQVAESKFIDEQGIERASPNKWLALYIAGQIYHAQSKIDKALEFYEQVKLQFSDANEAVDFFEHKFVRLPEVTIFHPDGDGYRESSELARLQRAIGIPRGIAINGQNAPDHGAMSQKYGRPFVQMEYRNVKSAVLQVYRVDLMKLALVEKNLNQIAAVNLAGIKPIFEKTVDLNGELTYVDKSQRVPLELKSAESGKPLAEGAYLVICRGGDLFSSGLVLVTPLAVEVQEDAGAGRTRVSVVEALTRGGVKNVHVKVIGTGMSRFVSGDTDLRGMFVADEVNGAPTAIARDSNGHFAFYRSESIEATRLAERIASNQLKQKAVEPGSKADYRTNLSGDNRAMQLENCQWLDQNFKKAGKGVQVQKAQ